MCHLHGDSLPEREENSGQEKHCTTFHQSVCAAFVDTSEPLGGLALLEGNLSLLLEIIIVVGTGAKMLVDRREEGLEL